MKDRGLSSLPQELDARSADTGVDSAGSSVGASAPPVRAIVAQVGGRRRYAVPRMLCQQGALARLYTDLCFTRRFRVLHRLPFVGSGVRRRSVRGIPPELVRSAPWTTWFALRAGRTRKASPWELYLELDEAFGRAMIRWGIGEANLVYGMFGSGTPFWSFARSQGLKVAAELFITPLAHEIVRRERAAFPDWEPDPPDAAREAELVEMLTQRCIAAADLLLCPAETVQEGLLEFMRHPARRHLRMPATAIVPYGFDSAAPSGPTAPVPGRILFVGSADLRKGIHYLAAAARALDRQGRSFEFRVAGQVSERVRAHPDARLLTFLGPLSREAVDREYALADLFVLPTLAEGSAEVVKEALAMGLPVVTTRSAGSAVRDGWSGLIVPERDSEALAAAIERIVLDRALRAWMSANARETAAAFDERHIAPRLLAALEAVLA